MRPLPPVILVYDWLVTLDEEINLFWRKKKTVATYLFLFNRYVPLVYFLSSYSGSSARTNKASVVALFPLFMILTRRTSLRGALFLPSG